MQYFIFFFFFFSSRRRHTRWNCDWSSDMCSSDLKWLAPGRLAKASLVDTVKSLYIPYWTFDASVHCPWDAEAGHYYYVDVEGRDSKGNRVIRKEQRVRWEPASGVIDHTFDDELVPGTTGVDMNLLRQIEPFPTGECVPYDTAFLSGHIVEH